jgi:hypothetical protein
MVLVDLYVLCSPIWWWTKLYPCNSGFISPCNSNYLFLLFIHRQLVGATHIIINQAVSFLLQTYHFWIFKLAGKVFQKLFNPISLQTSSVLATRMVSVTHFISLVTYSYLDTKYNMFLQYIDLFFNLLQFSGLFQKFKKVVNLS